MYVFLLILTKKTNQKVSLQNEFWQGEETTEVARKQLFLISLARIVLLKPIGYIYCITTGTDCDFAIFSYYQIAQPPSELC